MNRTVFSDSIFQKILGEILTVWRQCPGYFVVGNYIGAIWNPGSRETIENIVIKYENLIFIADIGFNINVEKIRIYDCEKLYAWVTCLDGNWYSRDSVITESVIRIGGSRAALCYEQFDYGRTSCIIFTDSSGVTHRHELNTQTGSFLH